MDNYRVCFDSLNSNLYICVYFVFMILFPSVFLILINKEHRKEREKSLERRILRLEYNEEKLNILLDEFNNGKQRGRTMSCSDL